MFVYAQCLAQQSELLCALSCSDQYDSHDERDDDGEGESVEEHKSVIMHLLSQVRLGMDLTKVSLDLTSIFLLLSFLVLSSLHELCCLP